MGRSRIGYRCIVITCVTSNTGKCGARSAPSTAFRQVAPRGRSGEYRFPTQPCKYSESTPLGFRVAPEAIQPCPLGQQTRAGRVAGAPPSSDPGFSAFNPRGRAPRPLGSAERASGQCGVGVESVQSQGRRQLAGMAPAAASGGSTLPSGFSVFVTFPDLLFILEFVSDSAPCSGKGTGWAELLGSSAPLSPVTPAAWREPKLGKFPPSLGGLFLSKLADRFPRQVQENLFLELCSFRRAVSLQGALRFPSRVLLSKQTQLKNPSMLRTEIWRSREARLFRSLEVSGKGMPLCRI